MRKTKEQKGITLIALVITIIVLLILAGVAINLVVDANGLFGKANEAKTEWNNRVAEEGTTIENILQLANEIGGGGSTLPAGWDANKVASTVTENSTVAGVTKERAVPIPTGFTASQIDSEKTIAGGLVIYQDGIDEEGKKLVSAENNNHDTALTTRNQYVWIPVDDINSMIMCSQNSSDSVCVIEPDESGTLVCKTHEGSADLVGRLYESKTSLFIETNQTYDPNSGKREPAVVTGSSTGNGNQYDGASDDYHGAGGATAFLNQLKTDFYAMAKSVYTYGGFYISRYEVQTGGASKKGQGVMTAATNSQMWYGLYNTLRKEGNAATPSYHMIWGSQYDQVIKFIGSDAQTGHRARQTTTKQVSGYKDDKDILKNIYDLEGNCYEWTAEANNKDGRIYRGR